MFEYLTGCWKRLYAANREFARFAYSKEEKTEWASAFAELKRLIISYSGMTLEDPSMFPQPAEYVHACAPADPSVVRSALPSSCRFSLVSVVKSLVTLTL